MLSSPVSRGSITIAGRWNKKAGDFIRPIEEHNVFNTIETARLILRPWHVDDLEELERLFADPDVRIGRNLLPERSSPFPRAACSSGKEISLTERERSKL
jgi:RimJ/RimL family protein N-acetyltransferase